MTACRTGYRFFADPDSSIKVTEQWLERWEEGRIGWHEPDGNANLKRHWPDLPENSRVLVPLCGKSYDLIWLANRGLDVVGVELSRTAIASFFDDHELEYEVDSDGKLQRYRATAQRISIFCGDYFNFESPPFDALFDRGALVAMPLDERPRYVKHTEALLAQNAYRLIISIEYDQAAANGPPYAVMSDEIKSYWDDVHLLSRHNDIDNCPPKFKAAGLTEVMEAAWSSGQ
jgi:thiopurine S-methyltransferase